MFLKKQEVHNFKFPCENLQNRTTTPNFQDVKKKEIFLAGLSIPYLNGKYETTRISCGGRPTDANKAAVVQVKLSCDIITPFGLPVVPLV